MPDADTTASALIVLRSVERQDAEFLRRVANEPMLREMLFEEPTSLGYWEKSVALWNEDPDQEDFIIVRSADSCNLGWAGINGLRSEDGAAWIKMLAILPEFWDRGYGACAMDALKRLLVSKGYRRIRLWTDKGNRRAQDCFKRNGFGVIDEQLRAMGVRGTVRESVLMEWAP